MAAIPVKPIPKLIVPNSSKEYSQLIYADKSRRIEMQGPLESLGWHVLVSPKGDMLIRNNIPTEKLMTNYAHKGIKHAGGDYFIAKEDIPLLHLLATVNTPRKQERLWLFSPLTEDATLRDQIADVCMALDPSLAGRSVVPQLIDSGADKTVREKVVDSVRFYKLTPEMMQETLVNPVTSLPTDNVLNLDNTSTLKDWVKTRRILSLMNGLHKTDFNPLRAVTNSAHPQELVLEEIDLPLGGDISRARFEMLAIIANAKNMVPSNTTFVDGTYAQLPGFTFERGSYTGRCDTTNIRAFSGGIRPRIVGSFSQLALIHLDHTTELDAYRFNQNLLERFGVDARTLGRNTNRPAIQSPIELF